LESEVDLNTSDEESDMNSNKEHYEQYDQSKVEVLEKWNLAENDSEQQLESQEKHDNENNWSHPDSKEEYALFSLRSQMKNWIIPICDWKTFWFDFYFLPTEDNLKVETASP